MGCLLCGEALGAFEEGHAEAVRARGIEPSPLLPRFCDRCVIARPEEVRRSILADSLRAMAEDTPLLRTVLAFERHRDGVERPIVHTRNA